MKIVQRYSKKISLAIGIIFILMFAAIIYVNPSPISGWLRFLNEHAYYLQVRFDYKPPLPKDNPILIVDIDDKSLAVEGQWPWPRNKLGSLVDRLFGMGAKVVSFDITFPEKERNIVQELIDYLKNSNKYSLNLKELKSVKEDFDYDKMFAKSLSRGNSVLAYAFLPSGERKGVLPPPLLILKKNILEELLIPRMESYLGNLSILQKDAKSGGFTNSSPSADGIISFSPMLLQFQNGLYPALAFEAARLFLSNPEIDLILQEYQNRPIINGIQMGERTIPLTPDGRILIPFLGGSFTFPYISASDVLNNHVSASSIANKLIFIGSTATALGDQYPTAISSIYPGVEIHASIASGIINGYLPYEPFWSKGVMIAAILVFGILSALIIPILTPIMGSIFSIIIVAVLIYFSHWTWVYLHLFIPMYLPIFATIFLWGLDMLEGYFFEEKRRKEIRQLFNQYVSPIYIDNTLQKESAITLMGENKEVTVLFSDIRGFTSMSEKMTAPELKTFLDRYLTSMTQVIFDTQGTIDKYIGDSIMAFWNAPLNDQKHAFHAVNAALKMQTELVKLNAERKAASPIIIGIGVNTGISHVGNMGSKFRWNYTVIGDTVNLASRLESLTKLYHVSIIVGESTYLETKDDFIYRKLDKVQAKGKTVPVEIYQVMASAGEGTEAMNKELEAHHHALEFYFHRKWNEAQPLFKQLAESYPQNQLLYEVYLQRIQTLPSPGPEWDGTYEMQTK